MRTEIFPHSFENLFLGKATDGDTSMSIPQHVLFSIFSGKALLFLGAGFSKGAKSLSLTGELTDFPGAQELAADLIKDLGLDIKESLDRCAGFYESETSRSHLLSTLAKRLEVKSVADFQKNILSCPWNRIYTTNYDNIIPSAKSLPKKVRNIGLKDRIPHYTNSTIECLYINGYIDMTSPQESSIIITNTDYASTNNEQRKDIVHMFRSDVSIVENVFFLGYSIYDIEVAQILQEDTSIRKKIFFVVGPNINKIHEATISKYGTVLKITCEDFSHLLTKAKEEYSLIPPVQEKVFTSLEEYKIIKTDQSTASISKGDPIFDLLVGSKINREYIQNSLQNRHNDILIRTNVDLIQDYIDNNKKIIIIHSHICNGKTIFLEELAAKLNEFHPIFFASPSNQSLNRELIELSKLYENKKIIVIIDGYARAICEISQIIDKLSNVTFILSERTAIHKIVFPNSKLSDAEIFSLDQLDEQEISDFAKMLINNGITGMTERKLISDITNKYENSIGKTIVSLIEQSEAANRFIEKIRKDILDNIQYRNEVYTIIMLTILTGQPIKKSIINEILDVQTAYSRNFIQTTLFHDLFINKDDAIVCPGVLPYITSKRVFNPEYARSTALSLAKYAYLHRSKPFYDNISSLSMRYSFLQNALPNENFLPNSTAFYKELRKVGDLGNFPLFWLQFAIAKLNYSEFAMARQYLNSAYQMATRTNFNTYQIDNQYARLMLMADDTIPESPYERFLKAENLLTHQLINSQDRYAYRAAATLTYFKKYFHTLTTEQLIKVQKFINLIETCERNLPTDVKKEVSFDMERIAEAKVSLEKNLLMRN